jgi:hypothetical protein
LVILVNMALDTNYWSQVSIPGSNDLTAIQMRDNYGQFTIINRYNDCNDSKVIETLDTYLKGNRWHICTHDTDYMLWCGDFNRHHPLWDEERNHHLFTARALRDAEELLEKVTDYNMVMVLPKHIPTLEAKVTKKLDTPQ